MEDSTNKIAKSSDIKPMLLREKHMLKLLSVSKSSLWLGVKLGTYPAPVKISPKVTAWRMADVEAWVAGLNPAGQEGA